MKYKFPEEPQRELIEPEAIRRAQNGDVTGFESLYQAHSKRVYGICLRMLKNPFDAEDLTQQIFLRVFRGIGTFRGDSAFSTWLHRVTVNTVLMHIRQKKPVEISLDGPAHAGQSHEIPFERGPSDTSMLGAIDRWNLLHAILDLPCSYKLIFLLHDVMGYRHSEIAEFVGCSIACSKSQVHRARKRLRHLLHHPPLRQTIERKLPA